MTWYQYILWQEAPSLLCCESLENERCCIVCSKAAQCSDPPIWQPLQHHTECVSLWKKSVEVVMGEQSGEHPCGGICTCASLCQGRWKTMGLVSVGNQWWTALTRPSANLCRFRVQIYQRKVTRLTCKILFAQMSSIIQSNIFKTKSHHFSVIF